MCDIYFQSIVDNIYDWFLIFFTVHYLPETSITYSNIRGTGLYMKVGNKVTDKKSQVIKSQRGKKTTQLNHDLKTINWYIKIKNWQCNIIILQVVPTISAVCLARVYKNLNKQVSSVNKIMLWCYFLWLCFCDFFTSDVFPMQNSEFFCYFFLPSTIYIKLWCEHVSMCVYIQICRLSRSESNDVHLQSTRLSLGMDIC